MQKGTTGTQQGGIPMGLGAQNMTMSMGSNSQIQGGKQSQLMADIKLISLQVF